MGEISKNRVFIRKPQSNNNGMQNKFSSLAAKVLSGEASLKEKEELQRFIKESDENAFLFHQIEEYWNAEVSFTENKTFQHFDQQLWREFETASRPIPTQRKIYFPTLYKVAAIVFFVLSCSLFYIYNTYPKQLTTFASQKTITDYTLEDGSIVKLNKNSSITFDSGFDKKERIVNLTGEAFFEVHKDVNRPFIVRAQGTETVVLGTSFNVKSDLENKLVTTTLVEGSVRFDSDEDQIKLTPGEELIYNIEDRTFISQKIDLQYNTAWTAGRYIYSDITFGQLTQKLEDIYHVKINIRDKVISEKYVSASFLIEQSVDEILSALEGELKFNYNFREESIIDIIGKK